MFPGFRGQILIWAKALFGKAIKFVGIYGNETRVIGTNRETLTTAKSALVQ